MSVQAMLNDTSLRIDHIKYGVRVVLLTCCENTDLVHSAQVAQSLLQVLSQFYIESHAGRLARFVRDQHVKVENSILVCNDTHVKLLIFTCKFMEPRV